jgi:ribosome biogenesis protein Nip4
MNSKPNKLKTTKRLREEKMRLKKERQWEIKDVEIFICEIKSRFVFCENINLNVYYETRFDDLIF